MIYASLRTLGVLILILVGLFTVSYKVKINKDHFCQMNLMFGYNIFIKFQYIIAIYWLHLGDKIDKIVFYHTMGTWVTDDHFGNFLTFTIFSFPDFERSISWTSSLNL